VKPRPLGGPKSTMHKPHQIATLLFNVAIMNFLLFFVIDLIIGGDALNGKVEGRHYYLGNHGQYTEVNYFVFLYSWLHAASLFITHPLGMLAALMGGSHQMTGRARSRAAKAYGTLDKALWVVFDSWRKPDLEFFTRLSRIESVKTLTDVIEQSDTNARLIKGFVDGTYFCVFGHTSHFVLVGRLLPTPHGAYIRSWHRMTPTDVLFATIFLGLAIGGLLQGLLFLGNVNAVLNVSHLALPIGIGIALVLSNAIGAWIGRKRNDYVATFLKDTLKTADAAQHGVQPTRPAAEVEHHF
jgi:hypothetical protein